jgi:flavin reductase (DIM6/NTAB) family NADH-FMN oxidoreductase RutF
MPDRSVLEASAGSMGGPRLRPAGGDTPGPHPWGLPGQFRKAVSLFATGIVVLSCEEDGRVHGTTVNSFTSVSLAPPTVLVSLNLGASSRRVARAGRYGISILDDSQQSLSAHFSGKPGAGPPPEFLSRGGVPTLRDSLAWFECEVTEQVAVHDHILFIARVVGCGDRAGEPLMYFRSTYHRAQILTPEAGERPPTPAQEETHPC